jgi:hypothetical protein
MGYNQIIPYNY